MTNDTFNKRQRPQMGRGGSADALHKARPKPAAPSPSPSPKAATLALRARHAIVRLQAAKVEGHPSEIAAATSDVCVLYNELKSAKAEDETVAAVKAALAKPKQLRI